MSQGLEALKEIKICNYYEDDEYIDDDYLSIGEYINIIEKELKALEIINKKTVDTQAFKYCSTLEEYNGYIYNEFCERVAKEMLLTKEEYDLLKEVLQEHE